MSSVNRLFAIEPDLRGARVAYVLDFAELATAQELDRLDANHDGQIVPAEREAYLDRRMTELSSAWRWSVDETPTRPSVRARSVEVTPGDARLFTLRIVAELRIERPADASRDRPFVIAVRDEQYEERPGWREIRAESSGVLRALCLDGAPDPTVLARRARGERVTLRMSAARFRFSPVVRPPSPPRARAIPIRWIALIASLALAALALVTRLRQPR
jgi:hypothetical protein